MENDGRGVPMLWPVDPVPVVMWLFLISLLVISAPYMYIKDLQGWRVKSDPWLRALTAPTGDCGSVFRPQNPHGLSQPATPVPEVSVPSSGLNRYCMHVVHTHIWRQTHIHLKQINKSHFASFPFIPIITDWQS